MTIGFDRKVRVNWLDLTARLAAEGLTPSGIRDRLDEALEGEVSGETPQSARGKTQDRPASHLGDGAAECGSAPGRSDPAHRRGLGCTDLPPREVSPVIGQYAGNTEVTVFRPTAENPGGSPGIRPPTVVQGIRRQTVLVSGRGASWVPKKGDAVRASPSTYSLHRCSRTLGGRVRGRGPEPGVGHAAGDRGQGRHPDIGEHKPGVRQQ